MPSLHNVAAALDHLCRNTDQFKSSELRKFLQRDFENIPPTLLSARIQRHLKSLCDAGIIRLIETNQKHNRSYQILNRIGLRNILDRETPGIQREVRFTREGDFDRQHHWANDPLGTDFIDGLDPEDGMTEEEASEWDKKIDHWAQRGDESPLRDTWNTLPLGEPGGCCERLFVDVRSTLMTQPMFQRTINHLALCTQTKLVVFHVGGDIGYLDWMRALLVKLPVMHLLAPKTRFATRVASGWSPRQGQRPDLWQGAILQIQTDNKASISNPLVRSIFKHRIWLLEELGMLKNDCHYLNKIIDHPANPEYGSAVSFGCFADAWTSPWQSRLYLDDNVKGIEKYPLGFYLKMKLLRKDSPPTDEFQNGRSSTRAWIAKNRAAFLMDPYLWIDSEQLPNRRPR
ncbi:MAG: hypothetical protein QUV35_12955 [Hydrogenophaga sp.]|uniref:hypothetical protein n=1 Tax=Hydrogenophaga sp. TaxID=1904254 RepID=UPI00262DCDA7|nr:hypothetical protein [Hydrogenophaga sp.]MDM7943526.1 hypothetical protein [Hydrogenophaga sp.]